MIRSPVLHAIYRLGLPSQPFIRDAIQGVQALGWSPWVVAEALSGDLVWLPRERVALPQRPAPLVDRVVTRMPSSSHGELARQRAAHSYLASLSRLPRGVLHAHFGWTGADCTLAARKLKLPFLVSFHGTDLTVSPHDPEWRARYRAMLAGAHHVTVASRFLEGRLRALGYAGDVDVIAGGVGLDAFPFSGGPRPGRAPRLLYVGRLVAVKGLDVLLAALPQLRDAGLDPTLEVIGDGPLRGELAAAARATGLEEAVTFLGACAHGDVRLALERADILVVPSRVMPDGQAEGSPVIPKEAQAIGVPVVATDTGGLPETIAPELRHELVRGDDPGALAARIAQVWQDRESWPERVRLQRDWVSAEFAWSKLAGRLSGIYERVLTEHPPGRAPLARALRRGWHARA